MASQIVKHRTGADGLLIMAGAYHGMTEAVSKMSDGEFMPRSPNVAAITVPDGFRHAPVDPARAGDEAESAIGRIKEAGHELAGFFIDPAMTSSGIPNVPMGSSTPSPGQSEPMAVSSSRMRSKLDLAGPVSCGAMNGSVSSQTW